MNTSQGVAYTNHRSLQKQNCRDFLFQEVLRAFPDKSTSLRVCTLSNTCYSFEKRVLNQYPSTKLVLVEHYKNIFLDICFHWAGTSTKVLYGDILKILSYETQFDVIWADMCSPITTTMADVFSNTLKTQKNCVFACTVLSTREHDDVLKHCGAENKVELRDNFQYHISKKTSYKPVVDYRYYSSSNAHGSNPFRFHLFSKHA